MKEKITKGITIFLCGLILAITIVASVSAAITDGAILYYSMDDADLTGAEVADSTANSYNASNNGATTGISGHLGESFNYTTDDYVYRTFLSEMGGNDAWSISLWFYLDDVSGNEVIFSNSDGVDNRVGIYMKDAKLTVGTYDGDWDTGCSADACKIEWDIVPKLWQHLVVVHAGGGTEPRIWKDGTEQNASSGTAMNAGTSSMSVGAMNDGGWTGFFDGKIDEVFVANSLWNQTEVDILYNSGTGYNPYPPETVTNPAMVNTTTIPLGTALTTVDIEGWCRANDTSATTIGYEYLWKQSGVSVLGGKTFGTCEQESANVSTLCGGLNTGIYEFDYDESNTTDGNWSSYSNTFNFATNYAQPNNAISASIKIKYNSTTNNTIPIFDDCFNRENEIKIYFSIYANALYVTCSNYSGIHTLFYQDNIDRLYEEMII